MSKCIIVHPEYGVYVSSAFGLGVWSKLDPVGQDSAVVFLSATDALQYANAWEQRLEGITIIFVNTPDQYIHKDQIAEYW